MARARGPQGHLQRRTSRRPSRHAPRTPRPPAVAIVDTRHCHTPFRDAEQVQEEGPAGGRGDDAHRDLGRRQGGAGHRVGQEQQEGAEEGAGREEAAVVGAYQQAHDVRHHQSHEADEPGEGHGRRCGERGHDHQIAAGALAVDAQLAGALFAHEEEVHAPRHEHHVDEAGRRPPAG